MKYPDYDTQIQTQSVSSSTFQVPILVSFWAGPFLQLEIPFLDFLALASLANRNPSTCFWRVFFDRSAGTPQGHGTRISCPSHCPLTVNTCKPTLGYTGIPKIPTCFMIHSIKIRRFIPVECETPMHIYASQAQLVKPR